VSLHVVGVGVRNHGEILRAVRVEIKIGLRQINAVMIEYLHCESVLKIYFKFIIRSTPAPAFGSRKTVTVLSFWREKTQT
jgi:hypothetical protein